MHQQNWLHMRVTCALNPVLFIDIFHSRSINLVFAWAVKAGILTVSDLKFEIKARADC